ncbi:MAG TPA: efflux RND transporter permease subunit, partial [Chitinophagales bacterium]|nr:efflux RND transporter permease subunit [Chitinophagales bacterium]
AVVVVVTVLTSLLVGFTLTPWMSSRIGKKEDLQPTNIFNKFLLWFERQLSSFIDWYGIQLKWVLNHKLIFTAFVLFLFIATAAMMKQRIIGKELIATGDQGKFQLSLEFDKSTSLTQNNLISQEIENDILQKPEVASLFSNVGGPSTGLGSLGVGSPNQSEFTIQLKPKEENGDLDTEAFMRQLREELQNQYSGINFSMMALGLIPRTAPIEITLSGSNVGEVMQSAHDLKSVVENIPGADNVRLSVVEGNPELKVIPDKDKMQRLGLNTVYVGMNLRIAFTGNDDASLSENGIEYPVRVWLDEFNRQNIDDVKQLVVVNPMGIPVEVSQFAKIESANSPSLLERKDRQPAVTLTADALGRPSGTVADDVVAYVNDNPLPSGIQMTWGSDIKRQNDSFGALGSVLMISFVLIYLIMVALYDSYIYPFVALFAIPVAAIGAFLALNLSLNHLSLFALLGLIMLMGLVTKNSILIVDFTSQLKAEGVYYKEAIIEASKGRMRPILMTTLSMAIGMLPIALGAGTAAAWKNGLAWVIIGGLLSSLVLTVFLVPMMYDVVDSVKEKLEDKK